jgi:hypothetical protein
LTASSAPFRPHHRPSPGFGPGLIEFAGVLLLLGIAACSGGEGAVSVTRTDSAGVEIVVSHGDDRVLDWTFTPRLALGGSDEGPESFYSLSSQHVAADAAGRIYVLDGSAFRVVAFDSAGRHLWSAGSEGDGPGELRHAIAVTAGAGGTVSVVDARGMKIEHFAVTGRHLRTERIHGPPPWMSQFGRTDDGLVVASRPVLLGSEPRERLLLIANGDTTELAGVTLPPQERLAFPSCPGIMIAMPPLFGPDLQWAASGSLAAAVTVPEYEIAVFAGGWLRSSYRRAITPAQATADLAAAEIPDGMRMRVGAVDCNVPAAEAVEMRGFGPLVPTIREIAIEPDGRLWVQRTRARDHRAAFDILASDGAYAGSVSDAPVPVAFLPDGDLVAIETDDMDVDRLVVYAVERRR